MKYIITLLLALMFCQVIVAQTEDATGFDGDNFSLEGALELFKNSKSIEDFENDLNKEDNYINNLDLNEDGQTDYIMVKDNHDGDVHAIVLQVAVNEKENQDIAVIEIEKTGKEEALLQIIGDEDVYGESLIVEPYDIEGKSESKGPNADMEFVRITVNVWFWPSVRYIYHPGYVVWVSPWRWNHYPRWWKPWRPRTWHVFHPLVVRHHHHHYYHRVTTHRVVRAHKVYKPKRKTSAVVSSRTKVTRSKVVVNKSGTAKKATKTTATRTKTTRKAANKTTATKTKTTATSAKVKTKKTGAKKTGAKKAKKTTASKTTVKKTRTGKKKKKG